MGLIYLLIDLHCHLDDKKIELDKIVENAKKAGVKKIVHSVADPKTADKGFEIKEKYPEIIELMLGFHPTHVKELNDDEVDIYLDLIRKNKDKIIGIGEIGLDYHWIKDEKENERCKVVFEKLLKLAKELNLPVLIHSWDAEEDCLDILENYNLKVILHCFSGKRDLIFRVKDKYYFTIPTSIVRSKNFKKLVKWVDISHLFTETDAPYLSPFEGKFNEPAFVTESLRKIAEVKKMIQEEVINNIWMNYQNVFK